MTSRELFEAIGLVDDVLVLEADAPVAARSRPRLAVLRRAVPLAACLCLIAGAALALRGGALHGLLAGGASGAAMADEPAPRDAEAAMEPAAAPQQAAGADAGGPEAYGAEPGPEKAFAGDTDGAAVADVPEDTLCALPRVSGKVNYWSSQLEPELQQALWADGEPEGWQDVLTALPAAAQPDAAPAALPVLCDGQPAGEFPLLSESDAQALLFDGAFLSAEAVPRGAANPAEGTLPAELVYNPAGAALRVPMWAFTVPTDMDYGDVVCYVPAVELETLRELVSGLSGG